MFKKTNLHLCVIFLLLSNASLVNALQGMIDQDNALWLTLAPAPPANTPNCEQHGAPVASPAPNAASEKTRLGSKAAGKKNKGQGRPQVKVDFESEHRPTPVRTYFLQGATLSANATAYLLHPDGSQVEIELIRYPQAKVSFKMPMNDDHRHGPNNVYVVDQEVRDSELIVRTAKWITVHHSCRWGHDYRNDKDRLKARTLARIPLDISIADLWDGNFHVRTSSGDQLEIQALAFGNPVKGAKVSLTTEKKWSHTETTGADGIAKVQLIRDYYPRGWGSFKRSKLGHLTIKAEYRLTQSGEYLGQPYSRVRYITTLPWKYTPASADYASYAYGLGLGFAALLVSGFGIYYFRERRKKPYQGIRFDE